MAKVEVKGSIVSNDDAFVYELFEMEHTTPKKVEDTLEELKDGESITVEINSGGGSVFAGSEIYTKLKKLNANVEIVGLAGSAASFIAMAGETVSISPTAQIMIHNANTIQTGDKNSFADASEFLDSIDSSIAYAYELKTGLQKDELMAMMSKETWLNAQQAKEKGFVDEIMFNQSTDAVASVGVTLPDNVINKVRNIISNQKPDSNRFEKIESQLESITKKLENKQTEKPTTNSWLF